MEKPRPKFIISKQSLLNHVWNVFKIILSFNIPFLHNLQTPSILLVYQLGQNFRKTSLESFQLYQAMVLQVNVSTLLFDKQ